MPEAAKRSFGVRKILLVAPGLPLTRGSLGLRRQRLHRRAHLCFELLEVAARSLDRLAHHHPAEYLRTSRISQEHGTFTTGLTNAGRTLGSAEGPDALSLWLRADLALGTAQVSPWCEWLRYSSDLYRVTDADGVSVIGLGPQEHRQRAGVDARFDVLGLAFSGGLFAERIGGAGYRVGAPRYSAGGRLLVSWSPALP